MHASVNLLEETWTNPCNIQELCYFLGPLFPWELLNPILWLLLRDLWVELTFLTPLAW